MSHDEVAVVAVRYSKLGEDEVLEDTTETEDEDSKVEILAESSIDECDADSGNALEDPAKVYTVEEAVEQMRFGPFQVLITFFCGMVWVAQAMEVMALSVLSPVINCDWDVSDAEEALITSETALKKKFQLHCQVKLWTEHQQMVFIGTFTGSIFWGPLCDRLGRKQILFASNASILVFGVLSAIPVSTHKHIGYPWLLLCRMGVGVTLAGSVALVPYYIEFLPKKVRGCCIVLLDGFWTVGTILAALLALATIPKAPEDLKDPKPPLGWHLYLGLSVIPLALVLLLFFVVPESARFYLVRGKHKQAERVIRRIAWMNCKQVPKGKLVTFEEKERLDAAVDSQGNDRQNETVEEIEIEECLDTPEAELVELGKDIEEELVKDTEEELSGDDSENEAVSLVGLQKKHRVLLYDRLSVAVKRQIGLLSTLFTHHMWRTTIPLLMIWFGTGFLYYGIVLLTTSFLQSDGHCGHVDHGNNSSDCSTGGSNNSDCHTSSDDCQPLSTNDYLKIMWTSAAEFPAIIVTAVILDVIGRKKTMAIEFFIITAGFLLLFICTKQIVLTLFLFIMRGTVAGVFQVVYVYTPEVYPTSIRAAAMGMHFSSSRIGTILTPFAAEVLFPASDIATILLYGLFSFILGILALVLPVETKGRPLKDQVT